MKQNWIWGNHACRAILAKSPERIINVYMVDSSRADRAKDLELLGSLGIGIEWVDRDRLTQLCSSKNHQGFAVTAKPKKMLAEADLSQLVDKLVQNGEMPLLLVLDQVQDPHNLGACLRTADAAGVHAVVIPKDRSCGITPVVGKVSSGALETMDLVSVTNLARTLESLKSKGLWVIGTSDKAQNTLYKQDFSSPIALVMGAEGAGIRKLTEKSCDALIQIPMSGSVVSSLNVSVATGVCLYEINRARGRYSL